jgi:cyclopropane fatty-acyl-phospholipid synthase-like methyltransferase
MEDCLLYESQLKFYLYSFVGSVVGTHFLQNVFQPSVGTSKYAILRNWMIANIWYTQSLNSVLILLGFTTIVELVDFYTGHTIDPVQNRTDRCYESVAQYIALLPKETQAKIENFSGGLYENGDETPEEMLVNKMHWIAKNSGITKGTKLLDIGCGTGYLMNFMEKEYGAEVYGIQLAEDAVTNNIYPNLNGKVFAANIKTLNKPEWDNYFDVLILNGSTEHFGTYRDFIVDKMESIYKVVHDQMNKLIKPGGRLFYSGIYTKDYQNKLSFWQWYYLYLVEREFGGWYPEKDPKGFMQSDYWDCKVIKDTTEGYYKYWKEYHDALYLTPNPTFWIPGVIMMLKQIAIDPFFIQAWILAMFPKNAFTEHLNPYDHWGSCRETFQVWEKYKNETENRVKDILK